MKKVFHIVARLDIGGSERVAINIASSDNRDIEYHVVEVVRASTPTTRSLLSEMRSKGIIVHRFFFPNWQFHYIPQKLAAFLFPLWFVWLFLKHRPDVIHSHTEIPDIAVFCFAKLFPKLLKNTTIVRTIHNNVLWTGTKRLGRKVEAFMQNHKANVGISLSVIDSYKKEFGADVSRLIHNGVSEPENVKTYATDSQPVSRKTSILFAGRFEQQKGITTLIQIIKQCSPELYTFTIVGSGRLEQLLHQEIKAQENVHFLSAIPHLSSHLHEYDYLLMPSEFEGLPLLAIEAALAKVPVIANLAPGLRETLPEDWPLAVNNNNINEWTALFRNTLPTAPKAALAQQLNNFATERFSLEKMQREYEKLYL